MKHTDRQEPAQEPERNATTEQTEQPKPTPARRNPRLVIGNLDYFWLLMEQDEI